MTDSRMTTPAQSSQNGNDVHPPALAALLARVSQLVSAGDPKAAIETMGRATPKSPWVDNAIGVCLMRLGMWQQALDVFRGLALGPGGVVLRADAPPVFKSNFAAALAATGNLDGFFRALSDLRDENHSSVVKLRDRVDQWTAGFTSWQKIQWHLGASQPAPFPIDTNLGDLD